MPVQPQLLDTFPRPMQGIENTRVEHSPQCIESSFGDWISLLKPRVLVLVTFTGIVGMILAPGHLHPVLLLATIISITVGAGAAGALNMWYDRDIDSKMKRTLHRPIPAGKIHHDDVLAYGILLASGSVILLFLSTNAVAAAILLLSILFYVVIYTAFLKRRTFQNIVIGGAAGSFPPLIGWSAVTGDIAAFPVLMCALIFFWTPPHFWALSLYRHADYEKANVPMLPVIKGAWSTRLHIAAYTLILFIVSIAPWLFGWAGNFYAVAAIILGVIFIGLSTAALLDSQDASGKSLSGDKPARMTFKYSLIYLFAIFSLLAFQ